MQRGVSHKSYKKASIKAHLLLQGLSIFIANLGIGIWIWTIDKFYTGSMNWWGYLLPVIAMSIAVPDMIMEVLKFMKKKK